MVETINAQLDHAEFYPQKEGEAEFEKNITPEYSVQRKTIEKFFEDDNYIAIEESDEIDYLLESFYSYEKEEIEEILEIIDGKEAFLIFDMKGEPIIGFKHSQNFDREIPKGYALMGGAVRSLLLAEIDGIETKPRDIDLAAIDVLEPDMSLYEDVSAKYMPYDFKNGYGVSCIEDEEDPEIKKPLSILEYFETRDFTINEILASGDLVLASPEALLDLKHKRIIPTDYERDDRSFRSYHYDRNGIQPKLVLKAERLKLQLEKDYGHAASVHGIAEWQLTLDGITLPALATNVEKAIEGGDLMALQFYELLFEKGIISSPNIEGRRNAIQGDNLEEVALSIRLSLSDIQSNKSVSERKHHWEFNNPTIDNAESPADYVAKNPYANKFAEMEYYEDLAASALAKNHKLSKTDEAKAYRLGNSLYKYLEKYGYQKARKYSRTEEGSLDDMHDVNPPLVSSMEMAIRKSLDETPSAEDIEGMSKNTSHEEDITKYFEGFEEDEDAVSEATLGLSALARIHEKKEEEKEPALDKNDPVT